MPDISEETQLAASYVPASLYQQWTDHADDLGLSISRYIVRMVEAGRKPIDPETVSKDTLRDLQQQRTDLKQELQRARERIETLENRLYRSEQSEIVAYVDDNPGATTAEIIQHIADTVPGRVATHLDTLETDQIERRDDRFYCADSADANSFNRDTEV